MRRGNTPREASAIAINRIAKYYPEFSGAIIAANKNGDYAIACNGMTSFPYIVVSDGNVTLHTAACAVETDSGIGHNQQMIVFVFVFFIVAVLG